MKRVNKIKNLLWVPIRSLFSKGTINNAGVFPSKGFEPSCSFSLWLMDSYRNDFIEESLPCRLSDNTSKLALRDFGIGVWHWNVRTDVVFYSLETLKMLEVESDDLFDNWNRWYKVVHRDDLVG